VLVITKVVSSNPVHGEVYSIQHYVMKFVSDMRFKHFAAVVSILISDQQKNTYSVEMILDIRSTQNFLNPIGFVNWLYIYIFTLVVVTGDILCVMCKMKQIQLDTHGEVYSIQHYVIKFVSDLQQVCGILRIF
jgi:hypothetical protein